MRGMVPSGRRRLSALGQWSLTHPPGNTVPREYWAFEQRPLIGMSVRLSRRPRTLCPSCRAQPRSGVQTTGLLTRIDHAPTTKAPPLPVIRSWRLYAPLTSNRIPPLNTYPLELTVFTCSLLTARMLRMTQTGRPFRGGPNVFFDRLLSVVDNAGWVEGISGSGCGGSALR